MDSPSLKLLQAALLAVVLFACGGEAAAPAEIASLEQDMSARPSSGNVSFGVCTSPLREKCRGWAACQAPGVCMVPYATHLKYRLSGFDEYEGAGGQWGRSWKNETRRAFSILADYADGVHDWTVSEVASGENVLIQRGSVGCTTGWCNQVPDFVYVTEPTGASRVTLSESLPGAYVRPSGIHTLRTITIDVSKLESVLIANQVPITLTPMAHHFFLEHVAHWAVFTLAGVGSWRYEDGVQSQYGSSIRPLMSPWACVSGGAPMGANEGCDGIDFNFWNIPDNWELCQVQSFDRSSPSSFSLVTPHCGP